MAALGLVLLVVGVVMLTAAAPPQRVGGQTSTDDGGVLLTGPGVLSLTGEAVTVEVDGEAFLGLGRAEEVDAWADGLGLTRVTGLVDETTLATEDVAGAAPAETDPVADPAVADIWQQESDGDSPALTLDEPTADQVVVVVAGEPVGVELTWARTARHPGAWVLVAAGALELVLGLAWLVVLNARRARRRVPA